MKKLLRSNLSWPCRVERARLPRYGKQENRYDPHHESSSCDGKVAGTLALNNTRKNSTNPNNKCFVANRATHPLISPCEVS